MHLSPGQGAVSPGDRGELHLETGKATRDALGARTLAELRALPAETLVAELSRHHHITVDGYVLSMTPCESYAAGLHNEEAQLHGFNREEAAPFILFNQANARTYERKLRQFFPEAYADEVLALLPADSDSRARANWADVNSAVLFTYGHWCWQRQALAAGIPSYAYHFSRENGRLGSWHSGEEVYFYGNIPAGSRLYDDWDRSLSDVMKAYFVNFIRTGDPNGQGLPRWEPSAADGTVQELGDAIGPAADPFYPLYDVLDRFYGWGE